MEKIKEKPDPNAKIAIDFDNKLPAEREKQVKILVPNSTAGMIIGKAGSFIKQIKEDSGAYVQISQKSKEHALAERCITVIGELDNNKKACAMIISKIVEDPQSGSCLNLSYADVTGPVANFNPTGSPYANTGSGGGSQNSGHPHHHHHHHHHQQNVNQSNTSYSSNGSLNSLSPTLSNNFNSAQATGNPANMMQFSSMNLGPAIPTNSAQMIESIKTMLRVSGYSEEAVSEISSAMNTLANYGLLGLCLGLQGMFNGLNGTPVFGNLGMSLAGQNAPQGTNCDLNISAVPAGSNGHLYGSAAAAAAVAAAGNVAAAALDCGAAGAPTPSNNLFGPVGSSTANTIGLANHNTAPGSQVGPPAVGHVNPNTPAAAFGSPNGARGAAHVVTDRLGMPDGFDPFCRSSPSLGSPGTGSVVGVSAPITNGSNGVMNTSNGALQQHPMTVVNQNSFGLGTTVLTGSASPLRKSPTPNDQPQSQHGSEVKSHVEVEVGDHIVGAILGHGGKALVEIQRISGANIQISKKGDYAPGTRNRIVTISGSPTSVTNAQYMIEQQLSEEEAKRRQNSNNLSSVHDLMLNPCAAPTEQL